MATSFSLYTLLLLSFTKTSLSLPTNTWRPADYVCRLTKNPPLCLKALTASQFGNESLPIQAHIALETGGLGSVDLRTKFQSLLYSTPDINLKALYARCENIYNDALMTLAAAEIDVQRGRWNELCAKAVKVRRNVDDCAKMFKSSPVHEETEEMRIVTDILVVIAKTMSRKRFL